MRETPLCLGTRKPFGPQLLDEIRLLHEVGYDGFFTGWGRDADLAPVVELARELGLLYQSVHAPFGRSADFWGTDEAKGGEAIAEMLGCLDACAQAQVPVMVAHAFKGFQDHTPTEAGLRRFGRVVAAAERTSVKIAFENTEGEEYLEALLRHFRGSPSVGFCWDAGHEMCYNHSQDILGTYGDRLLGTHLNDNLGIGSKDGEITWLDDLHLLPFDGIADWERNARRLADVGFAGPLTFELNVVSKPGRTENDVYAAMPYPDYLAESLRRALRFADLFDAARGRKTAGGGSPSV